MRLSVTVAGGSNSVPLPSVCKVELDEASFSELEAWAGDGELYAVEEKTDAEIACQLSRYANSATLEGAREERALYLPRKEAALPAEAVLTFIRKPRLQVSRRIVSTIPEAGFPAFISIIKRRTSGWLSASRVSCLPGGRIPIYPG